MKQQKDSISSYGKFKFKDSLERNILSWSNMDHCHCLAEKTSKELMSICGKFKLQDSLDRNLLSRSKSGHFLADETSEEVQKTSRHVFIRSKMV